MQHLLLKRQKTKPANTVSRLCFVLSWKSSQVTDINAAVKLSWPVLKNRLPLAQINLKWICKLHSRCLNKMIFPQHLKDDCQLNLTLAKFWCNIALIILSCYINLKVDNETSSYSNEQLWQQMCSQKQRKELTLLAFVEFDLFLLTTTTSWSFLLFSVELPSWAKGGKNKPNSS